MCLYEHAIGSHCSAALAIVSIRAGNPPVTPPMIRLLKRVRHIHHHPDNPFDASEECLKVHSQILYNRNYNLARSESRFAIASVYTFARSKSHCLR